MNRRARSDPRQLIDIAHDNGFASVRALVEYYVIVRRLFRLHKRGR